jgi:hypothetical protein
MSEETIPQQRKRSKKTPTAPESGTDRAAPPKAKLIDFGAYRRRAIARQIVAETFERTDSQPGVMTAKLLAYKLGLRILPRLDWEVDANAPLGFIQPDIIAYAWRGDADRPELEKWLAMYLVRGRREETEPGFHEAVERELVAELGPEVVR